MFNLILAEIPLILLILQFLEYPIFFVLKDLHLYFSQLESKGAAYARRKKVGFKHYLHSSCLFALVLTLTITRRYILPLKGVTEVVGANQYLMSSYISCCMASINKLSR